MRGVHIFEKPCCREIRVMRGRAMRGLPVLGMLSNDSIQLFPSCCFLLKNVSFPNDRLCD